MGMVDKWGHMKLMLIDTGLNPIEIADRLANSFDASADLAYGTDDYQKYTDMRKKFIEITKTLEEYR